MDFSFTEEHRMLRDVAREFAQKEVKPLAAKIDEEGEVPKHLIDKMAELGFMGLVYPEEYGGGGADAVTTCLALEAAARSGLDGGTLLAWGASTILCGIPILKLGTEEQKKKYLPGLASGKKIGGFGLTEPGSGSDAAAMTTTRNRVWRWSAAAPAAPKWRWRWPAPCNSRPGNPVMSRC